MKISKEETRTVEYTLKLTTAEYKAIIEALHLGANSPTYQPTYKLWVSLEHELCKNT